MLDILPPDIRAAFKQSGKPVTTEVLMSMAMYRGPYMPATMAAEYERHFPGWGTRMLELTETQVSHRQELERRQVDRSEARMDRGQTFAFAIAAMSVVASVLVLMLAPPSWFIALAVVGMLVVGVGGPAVARVLAAKFRWPNSKPESQKP
jgi:Predicted membrane protein (DUF2335)